MSLLGSNSNYGIIFADQMEYHEAHEDHEEIRK